MGRWNYSAEVRAAAVEASKGDDKLIVVAMEHGVPLDSLRYWRRKEGLARVRGRPRIGALYRCEQEAAAVE